VLEARRTRIVLIVLLVVAIALITVDFRDGGTSGADSAGGRVFGPVERLAGDVTGRSVAVLGAGTIGLFTVAVLRAHGAGQVIVTDPNPAKRERAVALGADQAIDARTPDVAGQVRAALGGSADIVFDCVGIQSSLDQAIAIADKGGTVMVVGVPAREVTVPLPIVQDHQIRIQGSATYLPPDFAESADLLRRGAVKAADFVTAVRPLAQVAEAFALASSGQHVKVLVSAGSPERLTDVHV